MMTFGKAFRLCAFIALCWVAGSMGAEQLLSIMGVSKKIAALSGTFAGAFIAACVTIFLEKKRTNCSWLVVLRELGLKKTTSAQLRFALIGILPLLLSYAIILFVLKVNAPPTNSVLTKISALLFCQSIVEELIFRGFIYRRLSASYGPLKAAALSGILFGSIHLVNLLNGLEFENLIAVLTSVTFGFVATFALAMLFDAGRGSLIGGGLWHVGIDTINLFPNLTELGPPLYTYLFGAIVSAVVVIAIGVRWHLQDGRQKQNAV